jgi:S-adenosylmethionine hydrolase
LAYRWKNQAIKNTLYCIDVAAKAITQLTNGEPVQNIGIPDPSFLEKHPLRPTLGEDWMEGQIIFIDNFENVIVNITKDQFERQRKGRRFKIVFKRDEIIERISGSYADVPQGEKLVIFNSAGYMEIAINKGNAAGLFGLKGLQRKQRHHAKRDANAVILPDGKGVFRLIVFFFCFRYRLIVYLWSFAL